MSYIALIKNNATGEIAQKPCPSWNWDEGQLFWWTEGNAGCDCNRSLWWYRQMGLEEPSLDAECGADKFSVEIVGDNGEVLYSEFDE